MAPNGVANTRWQHILDILTVLQREEVAKRRPSLVMSMLCQCTATAVTIAVSINVVAHRLNKDSEEMCRNPDYLRGRDLTWKTLLVI